MQQQRPERVVRGGDPLAIGHARPCEDPVGQAGGPLLPAPVVEPGDHVEPEPAVPDRVVPMQPAMAAMAQMAHRDPALASERADGRRQVARRDEDVVLEAVAAVAQSTPPDTGAIEPRGRLDEPSSERVPVSGGRRGVGQGLLRSGLVRPGLGFGVDGRHGTFRRVVLGRRQADRRERRYNAAPRTTVDGGDAQ